jgi:hypothetical protein
MTTKSTWAALRNPAFRKTPNLGLLLTSMVTGSVVGVVFIIPWLRARLSPDCLTLLANLLLVWVYMLMAFVRQKEIFFVVAALAGVGWTLSASELWLAAQRAMPNWARGRMNATVIMVSQGAMALGGVIWGSTAAIAGESYTLNDQHKENETPRGPLIFTVSAYGFVMALYLDLLGRSNQTAFSPKLLQKRLNHPTPRDLNRLRRPIKSLILFFQEII